ncbi:MAG TPA: hypothetical protein VHZ01_13485 [Casimicrobiaceae bacterium]|jgi:hypothetical protein|nr:hypothetical protein [Casimicrobiaceae bacterium]
MRAPTIAGELPDPLSLRPAESRGDAPQATLLLHTPGPIPPIDDDDDEDDDHKGGGTGGNIDPDDDEDLDDDDEDDDEADKQWASRRNASFGGAGPRFVL